MKKNTDILNNPHYNKGTAFTHDERWALGIEGLLPHVVSPEATQIQRAYEHITTKIAPLERYIGMAALQDRNEVLFYKVLNAHLEEFLPIIYTPTVGEACRRYSHIFRRGRGLWITPEHAGRVADVLANAPNETVKLIVVTDGERILGLGDLGAGGMGISIGKLALYTAAAGIHPAHTLPICLDVGTDNQDLLEDPLYIGWPHARLRGEKYDALVEEFITAVKARWPTALLQWEDFKKANAFRLLDRYRERLLSFNDDIQGTAAVALAGALAACRVTGTDFAHQRILILGAGAAGVGIARQLRDALARHGVQGDELTQAIAVLDSSGLLLEGNDYADAHKYEFAWPRRLAAQTGLDADERGLLTVTRAFKPTIMIGTSGQPGIFSETVVREMAQHVARPVIFPFSNPTANSEALPEDLIHWTEGRALIATGSPFAPVTYKNTRYQFSQGNNVYIFPGVGLGALAAQATQVTEAMFTAAAEALAEQVPEECLDANLLYPPVSRLREISAALAFAVARQAMTDGMAPEASDDALRERIRELVWEPAYTALELE
ncbi:MAG TPA: NAD-dependent malic enzyme [Gammaproteobacteria bacterium]|nr:NAD-dependent malic enzyme [Gammaproteobacteria bacterium]